MAAEPRIVLGISADYHDAAACILVDGEVVAAAEEERFSRRKHDPGLPEQAVRWCLEAAGTRPGDLDAVAFYAKPLTTYERILITHAKVGPSGFPTLARALRTWTGSKLWLGYRVERLLRSLGHPMPELHYAEHHQSHAASAYYPSPFEHAAVVTCDGVGEWTTSSIGHGRGASLRILREQAFPDSVGLFYTALTVHAGFEANDGEYKLMGLAPYGEPTYVDRLRDRAIDVRADGSVRLEPRAFRFRSGRRMGSPVLDELLDGPPAPPGTPPGQREADIARSAQVLVEQAVLATAAHAHELTGERDLCLAGGVALNCVANGRLLEEGPFDRIWVQPAAGDSGGALGAAAWTWHQTWGRPRAGAPRPDGMRGAALGPSFSTDEIGEHLRAEQVGFELVPDDAALHRTVAALLADGAVIGWFRGAMEFGPRALGRRSILADPRGTEVVARLNRAVKRREGFRPFAPAVLAEHAGSWFGIEDEAPYMVRTAPVRGAEATTSRSASFAEQLGEVRSAIPACTHVDGSARVQTVDDQRAPDFHGLLTVFHERTGCPVLLNTSFNGRGEPIVCTPADALATFAATGLDVLVLERCVVRRADLPSRLVAGSAP